MQTLHEHLVALLAEAERIVDQRLAELEQIEAEKAAGYKTIRAAYKRTIHEILDDYLTSSEALTTYRNAFRRAAADAFLDAFKKGYEDGGGNPDEMDDDDKEWLGARIDSELAYIGELFQSLKQLRAAFEAGESTAGDMRDAASARAAGYVDGLDLVYSEGKMRGAGTIMLTMVGEDGDESCKDCQSRKGKRYSAKKWRRIGYPPSRDFECKGYQCQHYLVTDEGERFTL